MLDYRETWDIVIRATMLITGRKGDIVIMATMPDYRET
jgi:hypothetical protein